MRINCANTTFVFDLDDTLYQEADYVLSGYKHIANRIFDLYDIDISSLVTRSTIQQPFLLNKICGHLKLPDTIVDTLVWEYRLHFPNISLSKPVSEMLSHIEKQTNVLILTDGRSVTQRLKLKALGLNHLKSYISEDYRETKLGLKRFKLIESDYKSEHYIYIGDNPEKDFVVPRNLGWFTFGVISKPNNIHSQKNNILTDEFYPDKWLKKIENIYDYLC